MRMGWSRETGDRRFTVGVKLDGAVFRVSIMRMIFICHYWQLFSYY
jgi:hypothetical protein